MTAPKILISNNPALLQEKMNQHKSVTVEAEYGDIEVTGTVKSLSHHGIRRNNPVPCSYPNMDIKPEVIGISHVDLDCLGGIMAVTNQKPDAPDFWDAAAFIDVNGVHKIKKFNPSKEVLEQLQAYWAFSNNHRVFAPRDTRDPKTIANDLLTGYHGDPKILIDDVTSKVNEHIDALKLILKNDPTMINQGKKWAKEQKDLDKKSFIEMNGDVILRSSPVFVSHLYDLGDGRIGKVNVSFNEKYKSCTVAFADKIKGMSCKDMVQELWGEEAGGHDGIAGSPRNREMTMEDARELFELVVQKFAKKAKAESGKVKKLDSFIKNKQEDGFSPR
jgi:hypothetical protein